jgi:POT family proton-dependent oligopeptide transporter
MGVFVVWFIIQKHKVVEGMLMVAAILSLIYIVYQLFRSNKIERDRLIALSLLTMASVVFWALFEQAYTSLNLFAERSIDRNLPIIGEVTAGSFLSLNALYIVLFAPLFAWIWVALNKRNLEPNTAIKFGMAIVSVSLGFGVLVYGGSLAEAGKVSAIWLALAYFLHTCGELSLSPVGLSAVTKLSPSKMVGFMMGVWFLATAAAEYVSVLLANLASIDTSAGEVTDVVAATAKYMDLFYKLFIVGGIIGVGLLLVSPLIKKLMHGVN